MTKKSRIGSLLALIFIIAFGIILAEFRGTDQAQPHSEVAQTVNKGYYHARDLDDPVRGSVVRRPRHETSRRTRNRQTGQTGQASAEFSRESRDNRTRLRQGTIIMHREAPAGVPIVERPRIVYRGNVVSELPRTADGHIAPRTPRQKTYTVVSGDNLTRIAEKEYGPSNGKLYRKIFDANRSKISTPSEISVGMKLVIPPLETAAPVAPAASSPRFSQTPPALRRTTRTAGGAEILDIEALRRRVASGQPITRRTPTYYVVRSGDNLTRIARQVLKDDSPSAVDKLFRANRSQLTDKNSLRLGMKLRIPS